MPQLNIEALQALLENGKKNEAETMLADFFASSVTEEEIGKAYAELTLAYIEMENFFNEEYLAVLNTALANLKELQRGKSQLLEKIDVADLRNKINNS